MSLVKLIGRYKTWLTGKHDAQGQRQLLQQTLLRIDESRQMSALQVRVALVTERINIWEPQRIFNVTKI